MESLLPTTVLSTNAIHLGYGCDQTYPCINVGNANGYYRYGDTFLAIAANLFPANRKLPVVVVTFGIHNKAWYFPRPAPAASALHHRRPLTLSTYANYPPSHSLTALRT